MELEEGQVKDDAVAGLLDAVHAGAASTGYRDEETRLHISSRVVRAAFVLWDFEKGIVYDLMPVSGVDVVEG